MCIKNKFSEFAQKIGIESNIAFEKSIFPSPKNTFIGE